MTGLSTRFAFKVLSKVFNFDHREVAANPVHLMYVLEQQIAQEQYPPKSTKAATWLHQGVPRPALRRVHRQGIQTAYLESYSEYGRTSSTAT